MNTMRNIKWLTFVSFILIRQQIYVYISWKHYFHSQATKCLLCEIYNRFSYFFTQMRKCSVLCRDQSFITFVLCRNT